jgi:hypothetical protein
MMRDLTGKKHGKCINILPEQGLYAQTEMI